MIELNAPERFAGAATATARGGEVNHRPAKAGQELEGAGEIGEQIRHFLMPGEDGFNGEFRKRLQKREDSEGNALSHEKLRGFGAPGNHQAGEDDDGRGPQDRKGAAGFERRFAQKEEGC